MGRRMHRGCPQSRSDKTHSDGHPSWLRGKMATDIPRRRDGTLSVPARRLTGSRRGRPGRHPWSSYAAKSRQSVLLEHLDPPGADGEAVSSHQPLMEQLPFNVGSACSHASTSGTNSMITLAWVRGRGGAGGGAEGASSASGSAVVSVGSYPHVESLGAAAHALMGWSRRKTTRRCRRSRATVPKGRVLVGCLDRESKQHKHERTPTPSGPPLRGRRPGRARRPGGRACVPCLSLRISRVLRSRSVR
jgi:hypothetical protein